MLHLKLAGGAVCQMKRKGVYACETVHFGRIRVWVRVLSTLGRKCIMWLCLSASGYSFVCVY